MSTALVSLVDGIPTTTSQKVAETFGKNHKDVLRGITILQNKCPKEFTERNFAPSEYTDNTGRKLPMYLLTRDGLTLLVMGYTGKEAMKFKLAYIEAFNAMEKRLEELRAMPDPCLSVEDRRPLSVLIGQWAGKAHLSFPDCWRELHTVFGISTVSELPASQLPAALAWVQARIDALDARRGKELSAPALLPAQPDNASWKELEGICKQLAKLKMTVSLERTGYRLGADKETRMLAEACNSQFASAAHALAIAQSCLNSALTITGSVKFYA